MRNKIPRPTEGSLAEEILDRTIVVSKVNNVRKRMLELIEAVYGHTDQWPQVRAAIMKIIGRDGFDEILKRKENYEVV